MVPQAECTALQQSNRARCDGRRSAVRERASCTTYDFHATKFSSCIRFRSRDAKMQARSWTKLSASATLPIHGCCSFRDPITQSCFLLCTAQSPALRPMLHNDRWLQHIIFLEARFMDSVARRHTMFRGRQHANLGNDAECHLSQMRSIMATIRHL